ncbi:MAG: phage tail sheath C-terminal domain-containing protein [Pseudomonadota bacterium]
MATYTHPGIYVQEIAGPSSIQGASTSVAAFVGVTEFGPYEQPTLVTSWNAYQRQFGGLIWHGMASWAVYEFFAEGGTTCYVVRVKDNAGTVANVTIDGLTLNTVTPGLWGNALSLMISNGNNADNTLTSPVFTVTILAEAATVNAPSPNRLLQEFIVQNNLSKQRIGDKDYYPLEVFNGFTASSLTSGAGQPSQLATTINNHSPFIRIPISDAAVTGKRPPNNQQPLPFINGTQPSYQFVTALETLSTIQGLSLLAVPDIVLTTDAVGNFNYAQQSTLINAGLSFCQQLTSLFYVIDPPFGLSVQDILSFKSSTNSGGMQALDSSYGAIYYPWVWIFNPISNTNVPIPPSGAALGRYAYTDVNVGVFKSPAGVNDGALASVVAVETTLTNSDQDQLNPQGINAIRSLPNYGNVMWGARTLAIGSEWTYISIRRLFIYVEQSLKQSLQWVVFEPNDQQLWTSVVRDISAFLTTLWQQGGLFGSTPREAFFVICDVSNNSPANIVLGELYIDIGLAPVRPAEFVIIRMVQKTAGAGIET